MLSASSIPQPLYACLYQPPAPVQDPAGPVADDAGAALVGIAREFSPRYQRHGGEAIVIDVSGLDRLLGPARTIGEDLRRDAAARGLRVHAAVSASRITALVLAYARPGLTVVRPGDEAATLAPVPLGILDRIAPPPPDAKSAPVAHDTAALACMKRWGVRTLGELAALPAADLSARLGRRGRELQAAARGEDDRPLVPDVPEERFESAADLEWPIDGLEPLSFVLTRLLEPLCTRLERRDRGAAALHVLLRLVTKEEHARRLQLPSPLRDVRTLRTLALLDLESHPPGAAVDRVTVTIDPTPGRALQHALFTRAHPTPEQLSTLLARLGALMGEGRVGAPAVVDSYRPDAFEVKPFATEHERVGFRGAPGSPGALSPTSDLKPPTSDLQPPASSLDLVSVLRRCRRPVPARVVLEDERPVRVTTDRRSIAGGTVRSASGPWRTSGQWWEAGGAEAAVSYPPAFQRAWNRDEWDVALSDGGVYRIFRDRDANRWFIDAIVD